MSTATAAAVDDALAQLPPRFTPGDLVAVTGERDGYYGRVGTLLSRREDDDGEKWAVRLVNGPILVLPLAHIADAAEFWSRPENQVEIVVREGGQARV